MRMAELSARSGTSIPSIKFYLREGLLPGGAQTSRNQADYGDAHLYRLRLIRALTDVGGLSVAAAREVLAVVDTPGVPDMLLLGTVAYSLDRPSRRDTEDPAWQAARAEVLALVRRRGWFIGDESPALDSAADAVAAIRSLGQEDLLDCVETYADAAEQVAAKEVAVVVARPDPVQMVEGVVTGTILGETILNAFRRMAQANASAHLLLTPAERAAHQHTQDPHDHEVEGTKERRP